MVLGGKAKMGIVTLPSSAIFFLLISLLHGSRSYDVKNNDDIEQLNEKLKQHSYYDVTHGKTINNPRIKEIRTLTADVINDDEGKISVDIEGGENAVKVNWIFFTKRKVKKSRNDIAKVQREFKKTTKWKNIPNVMKHDRRADNGQKSNNLRTVIQQTGWPKSHDVRTFTEGRSEHTGWPVVCVKKAVPMCSDVKFRGRKVTYCLYKLQNVCNQWD